MANEAAIGNHKKIIKRNIFNYKYIESKLTEVQQLMGTPYKDPKDKYKNGSRRIRRQKRGY